MRDPAETRRLSAWRSLSICTVCWVVVEIDGKLNPSRPATACAHPERMFARGRDVRRVGEK